MEKKEIEDRLREIVDCAETLEGAKRELRDLITEINPNIEKTSNIELPEQTGKRNQ